MSLQHFRKLGEIALNEFKNREQYKYRNFSGIPGYETAINAVLLAQGAWNALKYDANETMKRHPKVVFTAALLLDNITADFRADLQGLLESQARSSEGNNICIYNPDDKVVRTFSRPNRTNMYFDPKSAETSNNPPREKNQIHQK